MLLNKTPFGVTKRGEAVTKYTLSCENGFAVDVLDYGATIVSIRVPIKSGGTTDVCLGYDTLREYEENDGYLGAIIGRVAGRIANGSFTLNGKTFVLNRNDGENTLHGGNVGFDKYVWAAKPLENGIAFSMISPDGDEGFPAALHLTVTYTLDPRGGKNALSIDYLASADGDTLFVPTNHTYFNLDGGGDVLNHTLSLNASAFCEERDGCMVTGRVLPVQGTPFDFRKGARLSERVASPDPQTRAVGGVDHCFALDRKKSDSGVPDLGVAAVLSGERGVTMTVMTDQPGVVVYTSNFLSHRAGKSGAFYDVHAAVSLETQAFPDGVHFENFPSVVLRAGQTFTARTIYAFTEERE